MITLVPFLRTPRQTDMAVEKQAEVMNRIIAVLLEGIALHGFEYDPAKFEVFQSCIRKLREGFRRNADNDTALLLTGAAIRLKELTIDFPFAQLFAEIDDDNV